MWRWPPIAPVAPGLIDWLGISAVYVSPQMVGGGGGGAGVGVGGGWCWSWWGVVLELVGGGAGVGGGWCWSWWGVVLELVIGDGEYCCIGGR